MLKILPATTAAPLHVASLILARSLRDWGNAALATVSLLERLVEASWRPTVRVMVPVPVPVSVSRKPT